MANNVLVVEGTQILFADIGTDFSTLAPATANRSLVVGSPQTVQLDMTSVANAAGRQSTKLDLGATRAPRYSVDGAFELSATPTSGGTIDLYWAPSPASGTAVGNPGNISGSDAAAPGGGIGTLSELILQCQYIGSFVTSDDATTAVQSGHIGVFSPADRYGCLIVVNNSGAAFHSDAAETHIVFNPIIDQVQ